MGLMLKKKKLRSLRSNSKRWTPRRKKMNKPESSKRWTLLLVQKCLPFKTRRLKRNGTDCSHCWRKPTTLPRKWIERFISKPRSSERWISTRELKQVSPVSRWLLLTTSSDTSTSGRSPNSRTDSSWSEIFMKASWKPRFAQRLKRKMTHSGIHHFQLSLEELSSNLLLLPCFKNATWRLTLCQLKANQANKDSLMCLTALVTNKVIHLHSDLNSCLVKKTSASRLP